MTNAALGETKITLTLPSAMAMSIAAMAEAEERSMDDFILSCVEKWLPYEFEAYAGMDDRQAREAAREAFELAEREGG